jgi:outer membrane protein OmpA-like peptidoglycan-associated protein
MAVRLASIFSAAAIAGWSAGACAQNDPAAPAGDAGVIHLHMPGAPAEPPAAGGAIRLHPIRTRAPAQTPDTALAQPAATAEAEPSVAPVATAPAPVRSKASRPGDASGKAAIPFNFGDEEPPPADGGTVPGAPMPVAAQPALKTASLPPHGGAMRRPAAGDEHAGLTKRGAVMFEKGAADPSPAQFNGVKILAGDLSNALESGASRIQLEAYGGAPGDKSSDARRLSLRRALAVRQLLIDDGVPSNRIDVRAMGGVDDKGAADRVDVFLRSG